MGIFGSMLKAFDSLVEMETQVAEATAMSEGYGQY